MLKLGVIGTSLISHRFVEATIESQQYQLTSVYSRKLASAQDFGQCYPEQDIVYFTDLTTFVTYDQLDVVYIASPNSLHYAYAKAAIGAGKHVIVEKPAFSTPAEMTEILALADQHQVFFFEAARNIHEQAFKDVGKFLTAATPVIGANFTYLKYSSRYDLVLQGEEPNIFSPHFSGGALMDLGVYPVYAALAWFGEPQSVHYFARKVATGVDGLGTMILRYDSFDITVQTGKIADSALPSEIYFDTGTLHLDGINAITEAKFVDRVANTEEILPINALDNPMIEEAFVFVEMLNQPTTQTTQQKYAELKHLARIVNQTLFTMRQQAEIVFDADNVEK